MSISVKVITQMADSTDAGVNLLQQPGMGTRVNGSEKLDDDYGY